MKEVAFIMAVGAIGFWIIGWWAIILPVGFYAIGEAYKSMFPGK